VTVREADVQATLCATLVDQWVLCGLRHAMVAPGSRSTPMALALAAHDDVAVHVFHDERSAAFAALGAGIESGAASVVLCTSGTAATHFHAAVVEASLSGVPLLALTADRPPELHGIGAPQTIDQQRLFTSSAPFFDAGVADHSDAPRWRMNANQWWPTDGPVHLNLPFREPLVGQPHDLPERIASAGRASVGIVPEPPEGLDHARGVIVAGQGVDNPEAVGRLATSLGWPVLADPRSGCRELDAAVVAFDTLLRHTEFARAHVPQAVLHLGEPPASKVLGQWLQSAQATQVQVLPRQALIDPLRILDHRLVAPVGDLCTAWVGVLRGGSSTPWLARWQHADRRAQQVFESRLGSVLSEPAVARAVSLRSGPLVVASSMPIRDVEWFGAPAQRARVHSNRGANGIDGVMATGIGIAVASGEPTTVLLGDIAFCHDASSLTALAQRSVDLKIVVIDNDGGGIFSFLPQASVLEPARFEQLFGTPHGTDVELLAQAHGLASCTVDSVAALRAALDAPGSAVIRVRSDRVRNVKVHEELYHAVHEVLDGGEQRRVTA
jgi:2-succinyl-5-enolpyruvyl-6-hydroxy-3-cyclohexene-1-carboxylate synthase